MPSVIEQKASGTNEGRKFICSPGKFGEMKFGHRQSGKILSRLLIYCSTDDTQTEVFQVEPNAQIDPSTKKSGEIFEIFNSRQIISTHILADKHSFPVYISSDDLPDYTITHRRAPSSSQIIFDSTIN